MIDIFAKTKMLNQQKMSPYEGNEIGTDSSHHHRLGIGKKRYSVKQANIRHNKYIDGSRLNTFDFWISLPLSPRTNKRVYR